MGPLRRPSPPRSSPRLSIPAASLSRERGGRRLGGLPSSHVPSRAHERGPTRPPDPRTLTVFLLKMVGAYAVWFVVYDLWLLPDGRLDAGLSHAVASWTAGLLSLGVDGVAALSLFVGFVSAYPGRWTRRALCIPAGLAIVVLTNVLRCASLLAVAVASRVVALGVRLGPRLPRAVRVLRRDLRPVGALGDPWGGGEGARRPRGMTASRVRDQVERHPRLWGLVFGALLLVGYVGAIRPARAWLAADVALPLFATVDTPRARSFDVGRPPTQPTAVLAVLEGEGPDADGAALWTAPAGVLFVLPAMFLALAFPARPYWLSLLAYHLAVGAGALAVVGLGLGWVEGAFALSTFSRTYLTEAVSLAVPLLLWPDGPSVSPRRRSRRPRRPDRSWRRPRPRPRGGGRGGGRGSGGACRARRSCPRTP